MAGQWSRWRKWRRNEYAAHSLRLIPEGENREPLARLARYLIQGRARRGRKVNRILTEEKVAELQAAKREGLEVESWKAINPLWRLADPLTVQQAAALIAGFDPNVVRFNSSDAAWFEREGFTDGGGIGWVQTAFAALVNAINARKLRAAIRRAAWERGWDEAIGEGELFAIDVILLDDDLLEAWQADPARTKRQGVVYRVSPDWGLTTVAVADLRAWLEAAGISTGFFFLAATDAPDYLDPKNPRYAPKLAAAVRAWQSANNINGKTPKQALVKWLREHAAEFGMTDEDGKLNETGIDETAKVANWQPGGGAPKTPGE